MGREWIWGDLDLGRVSFWGELTVNRLVYTTLSVDYSTPFSIIDV